MSKEEKEDYKAARFPVLKNVSKRKLSDSTSAESNVAAKLARFAASKE